MLGSTSLYDNNVTLIKSMGNKIKVVNLNACRIAGLEDERQRSDKCTVNTAKLDNNLARAKSKIQEYVLCNPWDYFVTLTISPEKYDRYNLKTFYKDFSEFLHNYNRRASDEEKVKYLLVPELHEDGAWHMHGFLKGIRIKDIYKNKYGYLGWHQYEDKFGFISFSPIRDVDRASNYIKKYLTKDTAKNVTELNQHLYYISKGLATAELLFRGTASLKCAWDYETPDGNCRIKTFDVRIDDFPNMIEVFYDTETGI